MKDELIDLLRRQIVAGEVVEGRLRAVELVVAADEQRFVSLALDELERACDELSALELTRVLALSAAGLDVDSSAATLIGAVGDRDEGHHLQEVVEDLRACMHRVEDARRRAHIVVLRAATDSRTRLAAATAFADF